jgi:hypothetical protein
MHSHGTRHPGQDTPRDDARRWRRKTNPDRPAPSRNVRR